MRNIILGILLLSILVLAGCSTQTVVKYQCADGSFVESADSCPAIECQTNCPELDCSNCPVKTETKVETKTLTEKIYVCPDKTTVDDMSECFPVNDGWKTVKKFKGDSSTTTDYFKIDSEEWRYRWSCTADSIDMWSIFPYEKGAEEYDYFDDAFQINCKSPGVKHIHNKGAGEYYLEIAVTYGMEYEVIVEEKVE
jgi:hypothetical protein